MKHDASMEADRYTKYETDKSEELIGENEMKVNTEKTVRFSAKGINFTVIDGRIRGATYHKGGESIRDSYIDGDIIELLISSTEIHNKVAEAVKITK